MFSNRLKNHIKKNKAMPIKIDPSKVEDIPVDIEKMFQNYLYRAGYNANNMNPVQLHEMRKVHFSAISSALVALSSRADSDEKERLQMRWLADVTHFWNTNL